MSGSRTYGVIPHPGGRARLVDTVGTRRYTIDRGGDGNLYLADHELQRVYVIFDDEARQLRDMLIEHVGAPPCEGCAMACERPADDCPCAGCLYAAEVNANEEDSAP